MTGTASIDVSAGNHSEAGQGSGPFRLSAPVQPSARDFAVHTGASPKAASGPQSFRSSWQAQLAGMTRKDDWNTEGGLNGESAEEWSAESPQESASPRNTGLLLPNSAGRGTLAAPKPRNSIQIAASAVNRGAAQTPAAEGFPRAGGRGLVLNQSRNTAVAQSGSQQEPGSVEPEVEPNDGKSAKSASSAQDKPHKSTGTPASELPGAPISLSASALAQMPVAALVPGGSSTLPSSPATAQPIRSNGGDALPGEGLHSGLAADETQGMKTLLTSQTRLPGLSNLQVAHEKSLLENSYEITSMNIDRPSLTELEAPEELAGSGGVGTVEADSHSVGALSANALQESMGLSGERLQSAGVATPVSGVAGPSASPAQIPSPLPAQPAALPVEAKGSSAPVGDLRRVARGAENGGNRNPSAQRLVVGVPVGTSAGLLQSTGLQVSGLGQAGLAMAANPPGNPAAPLSSPSVGDVFSALDADPATGAITWTHAGAREAEAGFNDPALGWVGVRAGLNGDGVHATLVPGSAEAVQALGQHMEGLSTFMAQQHTPLESLAMAAPESNGAGNSPGQGANQGTGDGTHQGTNQAMNQGMNQGMSREPGQGADPEQGQSGRQPARLDESGIAPTHPTGMSVASTSERGILPGLAGPVPNQHTSGAYISVVA